MRAGATVRLLPFLGCAGATLLEGQRIVVTGGGRGIGRAIALLCAKEGAKVAVVARSSGELAALVEEGGPSIVARTADVTDEAAVEQTIESIAQELGGIDVLINNAGGGCRKAPLYEQRASDLRQLLDLNVVSIMLVSSAVLRHAMLKQSSGGHIINISSRAGKVGLPNMSPYVASKFAVEGLTAAMSAELAGKQIRVNSISPGMVDTKSFPKAPGRPGVRTAESIREGLLYLLLASGERSGSYLHVDEFDEAVAAGYADSALKAIDEPQFEAPACTAD